MTRFSGSPSLLDEAQAAGLMVSVYVNGHNITALRDTIKKHKDHPAVLCWMLYDEPGYHREDLLHIYNIYNAAYEEDPVHPSYLVITTPTVYKTFGRCCDILAVDTYPITNGTITDVGDNIALAYKQLDGDTPVWQCGQMFKWPEQRRPNPQEHRFMTYISLIEGAKGILWYTYKGYGQYLPQDDPQLWQAHLKFLKELNQLAPLWLQPGFGESIELQTENDQIRTMIKNSPMGRFILAANKSKTESCSVDFVLTDNLKDNVSVFGEDRKIGIKNGIFTDHFKPLDVHIYHLD